MLINASNLHAGGAVQVATSLIAELTLLSKLPTNLVIWASDAVDANLQRIGVNLAALPSYEVVNSYGLGMLTSPLCKKLKKFEVVFTVFGPLYSFRNSFVNVTGFAQPWIIYPDNEVDAKLRFWQRWLTRLKFKVQSYFFKQSDCLVVELEHVRLGLLNRCIGSESSIHVVRNSLSSVFTTSSAWLPVELPSVTADIKIGFVGRNYSHKNTMIFPEVIRLLHKLHGANARIYVTFTDDEWAECSDEFRAAVINVGPLYVAQCPSFYKQMDAVIFPSLLECFSATPLEAMAMEKPLFASDRPFNRNVCHEHAHYFDPLSPASAAKAIAQVFMNGGPKADALQAARAHAINFSSPKRRAEQYLDLLKQAANKARNN